MSLDYRTLGHIISLMCEEELNANVTVFVPGVGEYYPADVKYS
jgi:hypothetical protein